MRLGWLYWPVLIRLAADGVQLTVAPAEATKGPWMSGGLIELDGDERTDLGLEEVYRLRVLGEGGKEGQDERGLEGEVEARDLGLRELMIVSRLRCLRR